MTDQVTAHPHVLDDPPPFHYKLLDYGERPYWSRDGRRIAFVDKHHGDSVFLTCKRGQPRPRLRSGK